MSLADPHYPTHVENLERDLVLGASRCIAKNPAKAGAIAEGIKQVLDVLHPAGVNTPTVAGSHASAVLYPAIKDAMQCMRDVPEGKNLAVDIAWNILHDAFWSEVPAPASAAPRRTVSIDTKVFADGTVATGAPPLPTLSPAAQDLETEIQAKGLTAPRVTPADLQANISSEHYFTAEQGAEAAAPSYGDKYPQSLSLLTFCVLVLKNGFTVTGESACASPENFDAALGRKIARQNAEQKIWPLMGYELRSRLAGQ